MEITPTIGPEDIDPRKVQRLLYVALGCVVLAGVMAWLSARAADRARSAADCSETHHDATSQAEMRARAFANEAHAHADGLQLALATTTAVTTTTTEAPNAEGIAGDHGAAPQDQAGGAGAAGAA
jgi:hypothetical protein